MLALVRYAFKIVNDGPTFRLVPLVYDSMLTISDEVDLIWHRKPGIASIIFVLNRISAVFIVLFVVMDDFSSVRRLRTLSSATHRSWQIQV